MRLNGKKILITGAASGIGRAGALLFAAEGAHVLGIDRDAAALTTLAAQALGLPGRIDTVAMDLSGHASCYQAIEHACATLGGLDALWSNAGVVGPGGIENLSEAALSQCLAINLEASILLAGAAIPQLRQQNGGAILFTASISGLVGSRKSPVYAASKHGLIGLARSLAIAHGSDNIRVNALCPGLTETAMLPHAMGRGLTPAAMQQNLAEHVQAIPMQRVGHADEIARAALWLLSDDASYVTGIALPVDGGFTCG